MPFKHLSAKRKVLPQRGSSKCTTSLNFSSGTTFINMFLKTEFETCRKMKIYVLQTMLWLLQLVRQDGCHYSELYLSYVHLTTTLMRHIHLHFIKYSQWICMWLQIEFFIFTYFNAAFFIGWKNYYVAYARVDFQKLVGRMNSKWYSNI